MIHPWRTTDAQKDWTCNPGDPNQVDDEMIFVYFGYIAHHVYALLQKMKAEGGDEEVSAVDVFEFMKQRAACDPVLCTVYLEVRFAETLFLLHQAEESSDANKYVTALKFATLLFATNHCTKYTYISA